MQWGGSGMDEQERGNRDNNEELSGDENVQSVIFLPVVRKLLEHAEQTKQRFAEKLEGAEGGDLNAQY